MTTGRINQVVTHWSRDACTASPARQRQAGPPDTHSHSRMGCGTPTFSSARHNLSQTGTVATPPKRRTRPSERRNLKSDRQGPARTETNSAPTPAAAKLCNAGTNSRSESGTNSTSSREIGRMGSYQCPGNHGTPADAPAQGSASALTPQPCCWGAEEAKTRDALAPRHAGAQPRQSTASRESGLRRAP